MIQNNIFIISYLNKNFIPQYDAFFIENEIFLNSRKKLGKISTQCRQNPKMSEGLEDRRSLTIMHIIFMMKYQNIYLYMENKEKLKIILKQNQTHGIQRMKKFKL